MDGVLDYIKWYGEFSFRQKALTEVDNFIISRLSYLIADGIDLSEPIKFKDLVAKLQATTGVHGCFYGKEQLVIDAANTKRFGEMLVVDYEDVFDQNLNQDN